LLALVDDDGLLSEAKVASNGGLIDRVVVLF
jgi:hypothetical protein